MFKRIRNLWNQSEYKLTTIQTIDAFGAPSQNVVLEKDEPEVKAEFFGAGSEEEFKKQEREDKGFKGIFGL